jgi:hypothetical protein
MVQIRGRQLGDALREPERSGMAHLEGRCEVERLRLLRDRTHDRFAAMAGIDAPESGGGVEYSAPVLGHVVHVLGRDQNAGCRLELPIGGEGHPEGFEVVIARGHERLRDGNEAAEKACRLYARPRGALGITRDAVRVN